MTYIKIGENQYPATIRGTFVDSDWDRRASKAITLEMDYATAVELFVDGLAWSIVMPRNSTEFDEFDNSDYCVAGPITDNRDGTMTVKMGKFTELEEAYEILLGGYSV